MDTLSHVKKLYAYNSWATSETISSLAQPGAATERTLKLLAHIIFAQELWIGRLEGRSVEGVTPFPEWSLEECITHATVVTAAWKKFLESCTEDRLSSTISYRNTKGVEFTGRVEDVLTHVANHSTYHRGQIALLLRDAGATPAVTDFIAFARKM